MFRSRINEKTGKIRHGEQVMVADIDSSKDKAKVTEYLQGKITAKELINK